MTDQERALRLADRLEDTESARLHLLPYAAAELRRLHAENALLHERHRFDNGVLKELLEALRNLLGADDQEWDGAVVAARAAIAKAEGEPK